MAFETFQRIITKTSSTFRKTPYDSSDFSISTIRDSTRQRVHSGRAQRWRSCTRECFDQSSMAVRLFLWTAARDLFGRSLLAPQAHKLFSTGVPNSFHVREPPSHKEVDRWTEKRALFGVYDNIGILGDFLAHPKDLIKGPRWLRGWRGNELQRCIRKKKIVGDRMFEEDYKNLNKRIKYLYKRFNRTGKHR